MLAILGRYPAPDSHNILNWPEAKVIFRLKRKNAIERTEEVSGS